MEKLNTTEQKEIYAGQSAGFWLTFGAGIVFFIGLIDGLVRPLKCNN